MKSEIESLREQYADESFFFDEVYDEAIEGMDMINQSVIYNHYGMMNIIMEINKDDFDGDLEKDADTDEWNAFYDNFLNEVYDMFTAENEYSKGKFKGKIPPILLEPLK